MGELVAIQSQVLGKRMRTMSGLSEAILSDGDAFLVSAR